MSEMTKICRFKGRVYIEKAGKVPAFDWFVSELYEQIKGDLK